MVGTVLADTDDVPYNCGRLLAILERLQDAAHEYKLQGAGVVERYYGTASSSPAAVFPLMLRLARHHLRKLQKVEKGGAAAAYWIEQSMGEVLAHFGSAPGEPPAFPTVLDMLQQGRFALGFYQQKVWDAEARKEANEKRQAVKKGAAAV